MDSSGFLAPLRLGANRRRSGVSMISSRSAHWSVPRTRSHAGLPGLRRSLVSVRRWPTVLVSTRKIRRGPGCACNACIRSRKPRIASADAGGVCNICNTQRQRARNVRPWVKDP
ncbi:uncharacterized protein B0H18DRAFT_982242 [Fomitopsis serialis]|uniref:uncharacterized protein n=1 Tax=Fomitopsis serialis TaxID=139415 RepID=UPI002008477D|nr:uncharacterized protein B0H18DRAFT_982242 [Neoantrodia serialis]KAH9933820.1 hypothetical protein B0H18DRAFT_982242 [Neoantrodia serialis]